MRTILTAAMLATAILATPAVAAPAGFPSADRPAPALLSLQSKAAMSGRPIRVIVELREPEAGPPPGLSGLLAGDRNRTAAVRRAQAAVLARALSVRSETVLAGGGPAKLMDFSPAMAISVDAAELARLAADPDVVRIVEDEIVRPVLADVGRLIGTTWSSGAYSMGANGGGRAVAVLDTGVNKKHEFLRRKVVSEACYSTTTTFSGGSSTSLCPGGAASSVAPGSGLDCNLALEGCGHGTHVAGIAAGRNTDWKRGEPRNGVARWGGIVAIKVFSRIDTPSGSYVGAFTSDIQKGLERVYKLRGGVGGRMIDAVNLSLGSGETVRTYCDGDPRNSIVDKLRAAGIATVIASGNSYDTDGVSRPGCIRGAVTVGAVTKHTGSNPALVASYSNMGGPVDLLAPGGDGGYPWSTGRTLTKSSFGWGYRRLAGTSMAAPVVAGAFAAIRSIPACRNKTVDEIEAALAATGVAVADDRYGSLYSRPRIVLPAAIRMLGCG